MEAEIVRQITAGVLGLDPRSVRMSSELVRDLGANSLDLFEIAVLLEEKFLVRIDRKRMQAAVTTGDITEILTDAQNGSGAGLHADRRKRH